MGQFLLPLHWYVKFLRTDLLKKLLHPVNKYSLRTTKYVVVEWVQASRSGDNRGQCRLLLPAAVLDVCRHGHARRRPTAAAAAAGCGSCCDGGQFWIMGVLPYSMHYNSSRVYYTLSGGVYCDPSNMTFDTFFGA